MEEYEEISLRELIETVFKGKWIILSFTIFCVLVASIYSFFIASEVYESKTTLMISPITDNMPPTNGSDVYGLVESLLKYPQMTVDTYKNEVKVPTILDYIRQQMDLEDHSLNSISNKITVKVLENTNLITIAVKDKDPKTASTMANLISERFSRLITETNKNQAKNSAEFIKEQQDKEKVILDKAIKDYNNFLAQPESLDELKRELNSKLSQITGFKSRITQIKINEQSTRASLNKAQSILKETPKSVFTTKMVINDELLTDIIRDTTGLKADIISGLKLTDEQVSEIYIALVTTINTLQVDISKLETEKQSLDNQIKILQKEIDDLHLTIADKQIKYDRLNHTVNLSKETYDTYEQKYKEAMIKQSTELGKSNITVVSKAMPPKDPVSPNIRLNVAIAAVLGLMLSTFAVFIREYWNNSFPTETTNN